MTKLHNNYMIIYFCLNEKLLKKFLCPKANLGSELNHRRDNHIKFVDFYYQFTNNKFISIIYCEVMLSHGIY